MSGEIFIEADKARSFGLPVSEHLYLVFCDSNGDENVLRSGPASRFFPFGDMEIEVNVPMKDSADDRDGETPEERSSTPLDFDITDDRAWAIMVKYAQRLERADYQYDLLNENSNAFVGALLHAAGGEPKDMLPTGIESGEAVGFTSWRDIVRDVAPPSDWIFRGTAAPDVMSGLQIDEEIRTFGGNDRVTAGRGNDIVLAGTGNDRIWGDQGNDRLSGEEGADLLNGGSGHDVLIGGPGDDRIDGGHGNDRLWGELGNDRLTGGTGADVLKGGSGYDVLAGGLGDDLIVGGRGDDQLAGGPGTDTFFFDDPGLAERDSIADFEPGTDRLRFTNVPDPGGIALSGGTRDGDPFADLAWGDHRLRLVGLDVDDLTPDSFAFA